MAHDEVLAALARAVPAAREAGEAAARRRGGARRRRQARPRRPSRALTRSRPRHRTRRRAAWSATVEWVDPTEPAPPRPARRSSRNTKVALVAAGAAARGRRVRAAEAAREAAAVRLRGAAHARRGARCAGRRGRAGAGRRAEPRAAAELPARPPGPARGHQRDRRARRPAAHRRRRCTSARPCGRRRIERSAIVARHWPLLAQAVRHVAHAAVRSRGTVAGSVAHADPKAELPVALAALDARFHLRSPRGARTLTAARALPGAADHGDRGRASCWSGSRCRRCPTGRPPASPSTRARTGTSPRRPWRSIRTADADDDRHARPGEGDRGRARKRRRSARSRWSTTRIAARSPARLIEEALA